MKNIILILLLGFMSCDKYTTYSLYIDNQTGDTIEIVFAEESPYYFINSDNLAFPPHTKKLFYNAEGRHGKDVCNYTGIKEGQIEIFTSSGRELQMKIWNVDNWRCKGNNKHGWEKTFIITENDLK